MVSTPWVLYNMPRIILSESLTPLKKKITTHRQRLPLTANEHFWMGPRQVPPYIVRQDVHLREPTGHQESPTLTMRFKA